jgi:hypothetical protein
MIRDQVDTTIRRTKRAAQPAVAADRFAREIGGFLAVIAVRSRQLNGIPLGRPSASLLGLSHHHDTMSVRRLI